MDASEKPKQETSYSGGVVVSTARTAWLTTLCNGCVKQEWLEKETLPTDRSSKRENSLPKVQVSTTQTQSIDWLKILSREGRNSTASSTKLSSRTGPTHPVLS